MDWRSLHSQGARRLSGERFERIEVSYEGAGMAGMAAPANGPCSATGDPCSTTASTPSRKSHYLMFRRDRGAAPGIATLFVDQEGTGEAIRYPRVAQAP